METYLVGLEDLLDLVHLRKNLDQIMDGVWLKYNELINMGK
jgi:hypothetical protein